MATVVFPKNHDKYSPWIQKKSENILSKFLVSIRSNDEHLNNVSLDILKKLRSHSACDSLIKIQGHRVQIGEKNLWFKPGSKTIIIQSPNCEDRFIEGRAAAEIRSFIKELQEHATVLNLVNRSYADRLHSFFSHSTPQSLEISSQTKVISKQFGETLKNYACKVSIVVFVVFKCFDFSQILTNFFAKGSVLLNGLQIIGTCTAVCKEIQGALSLIIGSLELIQGVKQYRQAKMVHDDHGVMIAKRRMMYGTLLIAEGLLWATLGMIAILCPQIATTVGVISLVSTILDYVFRSVFVADSFTSLMIAIKTIHSIDKYRLRFEEGIWKNDHLTVDEKKAAARRYFDRLMNVTDEEKAKISEKCYNLPSRISKRLHDKLIKKRIIAKRLGLDESLLLEANNQILFEKIQKCFKNNILSLKFSKYLSILCLISNTLGFPINAIDFSKLFNTLSK